MLYEVITEKETVDEIIFRTAKIRNRIMLELMARGGMRIGEVLKLRPKDIQDSKLVIRDVITSYSIHYTKLYEGTHRLRTRENLLALRRFHRN